MKMWTWTAQTVPTRRFVLPFAKSTRLGGWQRMFLRFWPGVLLCGVAGLGCQNASGRKGLVLYGFLLASIQFCMFTAFARLEGVAGWVPCAA